MRLIFKISIQDAGVHYGIGVPAGGNTKWNGKCMPQKVLEMGNLTKENSLDGMCKRYEVTVNDCFMLSGMVQFLTFKDKDSTLLRWN